MTTIVFNGVTLNPSLQWTNRYAFTPVAQSVHRTLAGNIVAFSQSITKGQSIILEATEDTGWFDKTMVDSLKAFADVPGATYLLNFHGEEYTVLFDHSDGQPVDFTALRPKEPQEADDPFIGILQLLTI